MQEHQLERSVTLNEREQGPDICADGGASSGELPPLTWRLLAYGMYVARAAPPIMSVSTGTRPGSGIAGEEREG